MAQFNELPETIQERMLDEQVRQGKLRNAVVFAVNIAAARKEGGFNWNASMEGNDFWEEVILKGNFAVFYERHPKTPTHNSN